jgi:SRSO17 transposase
MSLPIKELPSKIKSLLTFYKKHFTRPQYKNFRDLIIGLIVSDKKNIQEIADCFGRVDQSNLNRFLTKSDWDWKKINHIRLRQIKKHCKLTKGILICDPTMLHKTGKEMEKANYHYSGMTKKKEWGHLLVDSFFVDTNDNTFPVFADIYLREEDADKKHPFRTTREMCIEQLNYALKNLPIWLVMIDAGLYADFLLKEIKANSLKYIAGVRVTNNISFDGKERINIEDYLNTLTDGDFQYYFHNGEVYFLHVKEIYTRSVGKEKLLISYKYGDEETIKIYTTNILNVKDETLMMLLLKRWKIEGLHRDAKQHLGLEDYQVRKFGAIQKVVCAVLVAYTQIILSKEDAILKPLKRCLKTIGEGCRFLRLIALKGWNWFKDKAKDCGTLREVMNLYVFVKNAKV